MSEKVVKTLKTDFSQDSSTKGKPHKTEETCTVLEAIDRCKIIHGSKVAKSLKSFLENQHIEDMTSIVRA